MKKDLIFTSLTQLIVLISGLLVYKFAESNFGHTGFSEFSIMKRNITYIYTLSFIGMGIALPRYIALEIGKGSGKEDNIFMGSLNIIISIFIILAFAGILFKKYLSYLLFGSYGYEEFIVPLFIMIGGLSLHGVIYGYYRGKMNVSLSNLIQVINIGIVPIFAFAFSETIIELFIYTGSIISVFSLFFIIFIVQKVNYSYKEMFKYGKEVLMYGISRMPANFGLASLFALPVIFVAHNNDVVTSGNVAFSISLLGMSAYVFSPVGYILLPKISVLLGENKLLEIKLYIKYLLIITIIFAFVATITYQIFAEEILTLYLGTYSKNLLDTSKMIMWGVLFYPIYVGLRSIIDAYYQKAYNTISILLSLFAFIVFYLISKNILFSFVLSLFVLTSITIYIINKILGLK